MDSNRVVLLHLGGRNVSKDAQKRRRRMNTVHAHIWQIMTVIWDVFADKYILKVG